MNNPVEFTKRAAFVMGIFLPVAETIRRWHQMSDWHYFINWFDDYLLGGFLLFAAWQAHKNIVTGQKFLAAGWGAGSAALFLSFLGQLENLSRPDPAPIASVWVATIKGAIFLFCIVCLILTLIGKSEQ